MSRTFSSDDLHCPMNYGNFKFQNQLTSLNFRVSVWMISWTISLTTIKRSKVMASARDRFQITIMVSKFDKVNSLVFDSIDFALARVHKHTHIYTPNPHCSSQFPKYFIDCWIFHFEHIRYGNRSTTKSYYFSCIQL